MHVKNLFGLAVTALILISVGLPTQARIKCWTNNEGVRECGEAVPPEYSQKKHQELNERGMVIKEKERAKTEEELREEARQAAIEEEKRRQQEEQAKQDRILLFTYSSISDIELARDDQLAAIKANIKVTEKRNDKIREDLDKRIADAAAAERAGKEPNDALLKDIESLKRQIRNNDEYIEKRREEIQEITEEYAAKIKRFRELKGES
ncbi:MAG: hypothetical protein WD750_00040 [Gammaproteobacteria bacterium]